MKAALLFIPSAVAAGMSYWQVQRMQWKEGIVQEAEQNMSLPPVDLMEDSAEQFRRVSCSGEYDHSRAVFVGPRPLSYEPRDPEVREGMKQMLMQPGAVKSGFLLVTPLVNHEKQLSILVNRGWVPPFWKANWSETHQARQPTGTVTVTGVVQGSEQPSSFVPPNDAAKGNFFWLDVPGIAEADGLPRDTPLLQVLVTEGQGKGEAPTTAGSVFPIPKLASDVVRFSTMPMDHFNYAVMWSAMAASMAILALRVAKRG